MALGIVGIGRMGANMALRLQRAGHTVYGYARTRSTVEARVQDGSIKAGATSLEDLVHKLSSKPRIVWLMVPAASVDATLDSLLPVLNEATLLLMVATRIIMTILGVRRGLRSTIFTM